MSSVTMNELAEHLKKKLGNYAILRLAISSNNDDFIDLYKTHISKHNSGILNEPFPNSGFDLLVPETVGIPNSAETCKMVSMDVKCEMVDDVGRSCAYYMYPRSSLSKTPLVLGNHVGIIDSGYRGFLIGKFDCIESSVTVKKYDRLLQIVAPGMVPIIVQIVNSIEELSEFTERGEGGFGSTGR